MTWLGLPIRLHLARLRLLILSGGVYNFISAQVAMTPPFASIRD
jgi:hypothetical protein